jgi:hypothetical protein
MNGTIAFALKLNFKSKDQLCQKIKIKRSIVRSQTTSFIQVHFGEFGLFCNFGLLQQIIRNYFPTKANLFSTFPTNGTV